MNSIFCFLSPRPEGGIPVLAWQSFRSEILTWLILSIILGAAVIVGLYAWRTRKLTIQRPEDPFRLLQAAFWVRWSAACLLPALIMATLYFARFRQSFPGVRVSPLPCALGSFVLTTLGVLTLFQLLIWIKGVTPAKFLYHPRWPWRLLARRQS